MGGLLGWSIVLGGPVLCALAGAAFTWLALRARHERDLDDCWHEAWTKSRAYEQLQAGSMTLMLPAPSWPTLEQARPAAVAATETLPALPAPPREGPRHARPDRPAQRDYFDPLIEGIRSEFDLIRVRLGLRMQA